MKSKKPTRTGERGQAAVEFLASIVLLIVLLFGTIQLILFIYTYTELASAAKQGVRYAVVHGSLNGAPSGPGNTSAVEDAVHVIANYSGMTITVSYPDGNNKPPSRVNVRASYPFPPLLAVGFSSFTISGAAQGRILH